MRKLLLPFLLAFLLAGPLPAQSTKSDPVVKRVKSALEYLRRTQGADGGWHLVRGKSPAATSLAVMAFLSAGHVPDEGPYGDTVTRGIRWILRAQQPDGTFTSSEAPNYMMYEQGITALMLAEVAGMTDEELSPKVKSALEKAVTLILKSQRSQGLVAGGWRYQVVGDDADVSVTGWQLLALRAARNLGCDVPAERIERAVEFLKRCQDAQTGGFCYQPAGELTIPCTGTAVLCLELCHKHHCPEAMRGGALLLKHAPVWNENRFFYGVYYCSQAAFQLGGNYWDVYRPRMRQALLANQQADGSWVGNDTLGPVYGTAMSVLALTVEDRLLPIYQRGDDQAPARKPNEQENY